MTKDVTGFEGLYTIDESGNVYSVRNKRPIKPVLFPSGYEYVHLCKNGNSKIIRLHRLVAEHFIPNPHDYKQVNHINGVKTDNYASNLEWCNSYQNMKHAQETGLFKTAGEDNPSAKLKWKDVHAIRKEYVKGSKEHGTHALAKKYNVTNVMISKIVRGECWKEQRDKGFSVEQSLHRKEGDI